MQIENEIIQYMKQELDSDFIDAAIPRERRVSVKIKPAVLRKAIDALRKRYSTLRFITITTVDHGLDFEFLHHFQVNETVLTLRSIKPKEDNTLESIVDLIPAANFIEREIADLFGVKILGHPQMQYLILTKDWPDNERPLRESFEGDLPPQARPVAEALISTSCVAPVSALIQRRREEAGLPRTPPFAFTDERALKEFHELIKNTNLDEKVGFDWEKKRLRYK